MEHYFGVCEKPGLRQRMLHRQLGEAEEFPAWKDNDQRVPEIDLHQISRLLMGEKSGNLATPTFPSYIGLVCSHLT